MNTLRLPITKGNNSWNDILPSSLMIVATDSGKSLFVAFLK
jgi:hypothetical protein